MGSQASSSTDGMDREKDRGGQRKCISKAGSSDAVSSLPWEIREIAGTRFGERTMKREKGDGEAETSG